MRNLLLVLGIMLLAGCATTNDYKRLGSGLTLGGYDESLIRPGEYRVIFQGQGYKSNEANVYPLFLRRCADLAHENGAPYFKVTDGKPGALIQGNGFATVSIPNYSGTLTLLQKPDDTTFRTDEIRARYATAQVSH